MKKYSVRDAYFSLHKNEKNTMKEVHEMWALEKEKDPSILRRGKYFDAAHKLNEKITAIREEKVRKESKAKDRKRRREKKRTPVRKRRRAMRYYSELKRGCRKRRQD